MDNSSKEISMSSNSLKMNERLKILDIPITMRDIQQGQEWL